MNAVAASDQVMLLPVAGNDRETTIDLTWRRVDQHIQSRSSRLTSLVNALFYLTFPFSCCCAGVDVVPNEDAIVSYCGVITDILRSPGTHCLNPCCLDVERVSMRNYRVNVEQLKLNDATGTPIHVKSSFTYQVVDALVASKMTRDKLHFIYEQAKSALTQVVSHYPYKSQNNLPDLCGNQDQIQQELRRTLQRLVTHVGLQVNSFQLVSCVYDEKMQKLFLAEQEAIAYIKSRKVTAKGACGIVEETILKLKQQGLELTDAQKSALVTDLIYMICNQDELHLRFFQQRET